MACTYKLHKKQAGEPKFTGLLNCYLIPILLFLFDSFFWQWHWCCFVNSLQCTWLPVVQIMCDVVAIAALGKACHHAGRMWGPVAVLASRYCLMLVFMAGNAQYSFVFGIAVGKQIKRFLMASSTHFVWCVRCHVNSRWHMGVVAFFALGSNNICTMWLVALCAKRLLTVNIMAETASQCAMLTLDLLQFRDLRCMAGQALIGNVVGEFDNFGCMRVSVATQAVNQFVVRFVGMTLVTLRNIVFDRRSMTCMAILTAHT
jgi:hypothetical protein